MNEMYVVHMKSLSKTSIMNKNTNTFKQTYAAHKTIFIQRSFSVGFFDLLDQTYIFRLHLLVLFIRFAYILSLSASLK